MASLLFRKPKGETSVAATRAGIIDIGSNSIRLVVYEGPPRLPSVLFNEKVLAGLGRGLGRDGAIDADAMDLARRALARFASIANEMAPLRLRTVATAAVREATNGAELIDFAEALGLDVELLSGEQEALAAGYGVLSAIPEADGIVGDLGGGSLELVRVVAGEVTDRASFPLGVLRIEAIRGKSKRGLDQAVARALGKSGWKGRGKGLPLYLVGGSWRALARLDMYLTAYPLPVIQGYEMSAADISRLVRAIGHFAKGRLRAVPSLSSGRIPTLGNAAALLATLMRQLGSECTVTSSFGLREGLLYGALSPDQRREDPLIAAAREEGRRAGRFPEHGDLLDRWIGPLFSDDDDRDARLRHAACLLADVGWRANPEFRAERGVEVALHGNWVSIDARGRAMVAQALHTSLGGTIDPPQPLAQLAGPVDLERAMQWGLAIRLGQRLSAGVAGPLQRSSLGGTDETVTLHLDGGDALYGETVAKRHATLAAALGREAILTI